MVVIKQVQLFFSLVVCALILTAAQSTVTAVYKYQLAIGTMFRNEARNLKEWIEFHKLVGVEHFYLYNNKSTDNYLEVLRPYVEHGIVEIVDWDFEAQDWMPIQINAFDDIIKRARGKAKWVALLDLDEFLFPVQKNNLVEFLKDYERFGGVCANWQMYGTSNVAKIPQDKLLIETLIMKAHDDFHENRHVKSIVQPNRVVKCGHPHFVAYKPGYFQVTTNKQRFEGPFSPTVLTNKLRINHYWTKDEDSFHNIKLPLRARLGSDWRKWIDHAAKNYNCVKDDVISKFIPDLKKAMLSSGSPIAR